MQCWKFGELNELGKKGGVVFVNYFLNLYLLNFYFPRKVRIRMEGERKNRKEVKDRHLPWAVSPPTREQ